MSDYVTLYERDNSTSREGHYRRYDNMLFEASLSRLWQHVKPESGFFMVSAFRGERTFEENMNLHERAKAYLRSNGLGYWVVDGVYEETDTETGEKREWPELSFFVPYNPKVSPAKFEAVARSFHRAPYNQEGILLKLPNEGIFAYDDYGRSKFELPATRYDKAVTIFTKFRTGKHKGRSFHFEGVEKPSNSIVARAWAYSRGQLW